MSLVEDNLLNSKYYDIILPLSHYVPVTVIMSGLPGSGKTYVSTSLETKDVEIFSTDNYFYHNDEYKFNPKMLGVYHTKNFEAFSNSKARIRIVDNTNLSPGEYSKYTTSAILHGNVVIVLQTKIDGTTDKDKVEVLSRNIHGVSKEQLQKMLAKYKVITPSYVGLFFNLSDIQKIIDRPDVNLTITQKSPIHVTVNFIGGNKKFVDKYTYGPTKVKIIGYSDNLAGTCLLTQHDDLPGNHITLSTDISYKPVDVGINITPENSTLFDEPVIVDCILAPMF
jgi:hypothetical protein